MSATNSLRAEHDIILDALTLLERMCTLLSADANIPSLHLASVLHFLRTYADTYHHKKEEDVLFPALVQHGMEQQSGPVGCMLFEHEAGRSYLLDMSDALTAMDKNKPNNTPKFVASARNYIGLMRNHIDKENNVLFRMAEQMLSTDEQQQVVDTYSDLVAQLKPEKHPDTLIAELAQLTKSYPKG